MSRSSDRRFGVKLFPPGSTGAGTNPEQLFATVWSACCLGAVAIRVSARLSTGCANPARAVAGFRRVHQAAQHIDQRKRAVQKVVRRQRQDRTGGSPCSSGLPWPAEVYLRTHGVRRVVVTDDQTVIARVGTGLLRGARA